MKVDIDEGLYKRLVNMTDSWGVKTGFDAKQSKIDPKSEEFTKMVVEMALSDYMQKLFSEKLKAEGKLRAKLKVNEVIRDNGTDSEKEEAEKRMKDYQAALKRYEESLKE